MTTDRVTLITPTCDRPAGIALMERWISRQTVTPFQWIVADGGQVAATLTSGQQHIHSPCPAGPKNLAQNMMNALSAVKGDLVIVIEDDDYYKSDHIERCIKHLTQKPVAGSNRLNYFNVYHRLYTQMLNKGAALCQTAFRVSEMRTMRMSIEAAMGDNAYNIDQRFWSHYDRLTNSDETVIGIKGLPGQIGMGIGHRPFQSKSKSWQPDPDFKQLDAWLGADAESYKSFYTKD